MADDAASEDPASVEPARRPRPGKRILIIVACLLVAVCGGTGAYLLRGSPEEPAGHAKAATTEPYVEVPAMVVNLRSVDGVPRLIKLRLMLVPGHEGGDKTITARLPVIIDSFQPFLRELRPEDLAGSAAVFRIKEELLVRANESTSAGLVKDVLIQDLIQQ